MLRNGKKPKEKEIKESDSKLRLYLWVLLPIFGILIVGILFEFPTDTNYKPLQEVTVIRAELSK